jgi:type I restriction enzyme, R subunit
VTDSSYLTPEARARREIDKQLEACGWEVQNMKDLNLYAAPGVAVREFPMTGGNEADYLLFVDGLATGVVEAKKEGEPLTGVELQSDKYGKGLPGSLHAHRRPLPFLYESTGTETRFTNVLDPEPRSHEVFAFHRPETMRNWLEGAKMEPSAPSLRSRLTKMPALHDTGLWAAQARALRNLELSLADNRPRSLIQGTMGSGKTVIAVNAAYRLIKFGGAHRVLFLVDRANLGRQALAAFQQFVTPDDGRKLTELYNVQFLTSNAIDPAARVCITTVQRLYSMLRGDADLSEEVDEQSLYEFEPAQPVEVSYNAKVPIETFDVIVVDECHRSIYGVWRQVLDYFDSFVVGLTATPTKQTLGFFNQNLVTEYTHEQAVADGVNVDFDIYRIRTDMTEQGGLLESGLVTGVRNRQSRKVSYEKLDDPFQYKAKELDRAVVAKDQIRTVIKTFKEKLFTEIFPGRKEVPKTLIFAKDDSHADDIVQIVREEFGKGNEFAVKITYRTTGGKAEELLSDFRNSYGPRIVVTVDMIATGTDVKPLECLLFMRSVHSRSFFEQMKGRGVRVINDSDFQAVTPDAKAKTRFVIVDAVGVTESELMDTVPLDKEPTVSLERLLKQIAMGTRSVPLTSTLGSRLVRLARVITKEDREELKEVAGGQDIWDLARGLVDAVDPDRHIALAREETKLEEPPQEAIDDAARKMIEEAVKPLAANPKLRQMILDVRRSYEQVIDDANKDKVLFAGPSVAATERAHQITVKFREYLEEHKDEITALQVLYSRPHRQQLTFKDIKALANAIERPPQAWTPEVLWRAYEQLDRTKVRGSGGKMLTDIVSLVRFALEQETQLVPYKDQVEARFGNWLAQQKQAGRAFNDEQLRWLQLMKEHISAALTITPDDFDYEPFLQHGGLGKAYAVFGQKLTPLLDELTEALAS